MQQLQIDRRRSLDPSRARPENSAGAFLQLRLPGNNLGRVHVEELGQLRLRLLALDGRQGHLRLEAGAVRPARSLRHALS